MIATKDLALPKRAEWAVGRGSAEGVEADRYGREDNGVGSLVIRCEKKSRDGRIFVMLWFI